MRQSSSGSLPTILMLVPLVAVPLLAMFGLPSFSSTSDEQASPDLEFNNLLGVSSTDQLGGATESIALEPTGLTNAAVQGLPASQTQQFGHSHNLQSPNHNGQLPQQVGQAANVNQNQNLGLGSEMGSSSAGAPAFNSQNTNSPSAQTQAQFGNANQRQNELQHNGSMQNGAIQNPAPFGVGAAPQNNHSSSNTLAATVPNNGGAANAGQLKNNMQNNLSANSNTAVNNTLGSAVQPAKLEEQSLQNLFLEQPVEQNNPASKTETLTQNSSPSAFDPSLDSSLENNPFSALAAREAESSSKLGTSNSQVGNETDGFANPSAIQKISGVEPTNNGVALASSNASNTNLSSSGVGNGQPSEPTPFGQPAGVQPATVQPRASEATQQTITWQSAVQQLNSWGINKFVLQPGAKAGEFHFSCFHTPAENSRITLRFEAESTEPLKAVENVLQQVKKWQQQQAAQKQ